ncbi:MAG: PD-(D/E)XK nuclease-like domain-containing protein, partial [Pseudomonadota bacterium]
EDASPEAFEKSIWNYGYHKQAAFYSDGFDEVYGKKPEAFIFIAVEKKPPYAVSVGMLPSDYIEFGRRANAENLRTYADCLKTNEWSGYDDEIRIFNPPAWAKIGDE